DNNNYVTTVSPEYYSSSLKKYTDCLVYVPYFAFASMDSVEKHFFLMPGVLNADYVVVQSDEIRNAYMDAYEEYTGKKADKKRFLALGAPMLDKAITTKGEDISVPEEWNEIIAGKKVILYNTSIKNILVHGEKAIVKMEDVFRTFQEQDDVVLLWRPHPLNNATISSMNPSLFNKYKKLIDNFREKKWGIYDDTSDVNRAIVLSDAYYGDDSSLLPMFGLTGKPILRQNINKTGYQKIKVPDSIVFSYWTRENKTAWFSAVNFNGLIELDLETMETKLMANFPIEPDKKPRVISGFSKCSNQLLFAASRQSYLFCYDLSTHTMSTIPYHLPSTFTEYINTDLRFWAAHSYKDNVYFFGYSCPVILKLNISSKKVSIILDFLPEVEMLASNNKEARYLTVGIQYGDKYYAPCCQSNAIVELNLENSNTKVIEIPNSGNGFSGIAFDGEKFWLSPRSNGPILTWNRETNEVKEYRYSQGSEESGKVGFHPIFYQNGFIWLAPVFADKMLKINCRDGGISEVTELKDFYHQNKKNTSDFPAKFRACQPGDDSVLWLNDGTSLIRFDTSNGSIGCFNIMTPDIQEQLRFQKDTNYFNSPRISEQSFKDILEGKTKQLPDYLYYIESHKNMQSEGQKALFSKLFSNIDGSCGEKTYNAIKNGVLFYQ
ncbi:MAG: CDP-glycerol glycerophosphotransferase family protein, partial [Bacteroidales bacterium]|nr:CDP-glycerol glycerophosphotransferase family protein [Bacteroidales bacterium]